ncbi:MAG: sigma-70 family RNA polymerase sigma factor [Phycisphaeraceae bacterium]|nr:sigma-70 family RNA polymerase sigma factor [Phycisphaeraceae bacterium]
MLNTLTTSFVARLKARDEAAWFELWETFGPVIRAQLTKWGRGKIGVETVRDLSQETLAALSGSLDRYDPAKGARFSTWLLAIAKHVLGDEMDRRMALKRGGGKGHAELDESWMSRAGTRADVEYEGAVFRAKVEKAIRMVEHDCDFADFAIYRMRVFDGMSGKDVAVALGTSEPTVSRRLTKVRDLLRIRIAEVVAMYSFTEEEQREAEKSGLLDGAKRKSEKDADSMFDECLCEIFHTQTELRKRDREASDSARW